MKNASKAEVLSTLNGICLQLRDDFTMFFPSDYEIINGEFYSENENIKKAVELLDIYKDNFNAELTIFFGNTRALTTIKGRNGKRITNTPQNNQEIINTVFSGQTYTASGVKINNEDYFVAYIPLYDHEKINGMVFAGLSNKNYLTSINHLKLNFILLSLIIIIILSIIVYFLAKKIANILTSIKSYLNLLVENQNTEIEMDSKALLRNDEFGDLARSAQEAGIQLKKMINLDPLTQIYNRRAGSQYLDTYFQEAKENKIDYTIVMCDIDHFKKINDTYGHKIGDEVLIRIANFLKTSRALFAIRWGGEEFLLGFKLPKYETVAILHNISEQIQDYTFTCNNKKFIVTLTFGVATYDSQIDASTLVVQADKNLYKGKNSGRNQIVY